MTKNMTKKKMGLMSPNIAAFVLPMLLVLFTISSQVEVVESTGRKLCKCRYNLQTHKHIQY